MHEPIVLFCTPTTEDYVPIPSLSERMIACGPNLTERDAGQVGGTLRVSEPAFDVAAVLARIPTQHVPDVLVVWADASRVLEPRNVSSFPGPKVLVIGDTHHQPRPIRSVLEYALRERFDAHVVVATRQHAHFFVEAGIPNVSWLPSLLATPEPHAFMEERRPVIALVGQIGALHPRRKRIVDALLARGLPVEAVTCPRTELAERYARAAVSLNVSLNGDLNFRPYEVAAAGGFLLTDRLSEQAGLSEFYREGQHYVAYEDVDDLAAKAMHYLAHPEEALAIARAAQGEFQAKLSRERIKRAFWSAVGGQPEIEFDLKRDGRVKDSQVSARLVSDRAALYEFLQERQRLAERVRVLFLPNAAIQLALDAADLIRLDLHAVDHGDFRRKWGSAARAAGVDEAIVAFVEHDVARQHQWDVLVTDDSHAGGSYCSRFVVFPGTPPPYGALGRHEGTLAALLPDVPVFRCVDGRYGDRPSAGPPRRLHVGGTERRPGWEVLNVTPGDAVDHVGNAVDLSRFGDSTFSAVYASHILEHFDYRGAVFAALREWNRVLVPGGTLLVSVPDLDTLCRLLLADGLTMDQRFLVMRMMFGGHVDPHDYHLVGLNEEFLTAFLTRAGFVDVERVTQLGIFQDASMITVGTVPISLNMVARRGALES